VAHPLLEQNLVQNRIDKSARKTPSILPGHLSHSNGLAKGPARFLAVFAVACLISIAHAAEPLLTLAMGRADTSNARRVQIAKTAEASPAATVPALTTIPRSFRLSETNEVARFSTRSMMEKRTEKEVRHPFKLARRNDPANSDVRLWASASLQAGYGEVYSDKSSSIYGHNGTRWEEPSCGYVKLHVRF
jgi:hypothetical protein